MPDRQERKQRRRRLRAAQDVPAAEPEPEREHDDDGPLWNERGSDENMDLEVLGRIRAEAELVEAARARKIERRAE